MNEIKKSRDSNIELCRVICMMMIIGHHAVSHGGGVYMAPCLNRWLAYLILPGGKICFDTFIAISAWFLVDQSFKAERFTKMWLEVLFYSLLTTVMASILGSQFTGIEWFSAFLPITGGVQGYAQTYLAFYLMLPFLSKVANGLTRNQNKFILICLSLFCFGFRFISSLVWSEQSVYCRLVLFVFVYFLMLYMKRFPYKWLDNTALMLLVSILGWGVIFTYYVLTVLYPEWNGWKYFFVFIADEGGVLFLITGIAIFFLFKSVKIRYRKWINVLGGTTLAVILIHDGHFFRGWTWSLLRTSEWYYSSFFFWRVILCEVVIYLTCSLIDFARKSVFEKTLFLAKWMRTLCEEWDKFIADKSLNSLSTGGQQTEGQIAYQCLETKCQQLEKEINRKNNALAEMAALYVLKEEK